MQDFVKLTGELDIKLYSADGTLKDSRTVKNLVTTVGKNWMIANMLAPQTLMNAMAVGTGTTAAAVTDTALQTELVRVSGASFSAVTGTSANIIQYTGTYSPGVATGSLTEAGILNSTTTGGVLLSHTVFAVVNKASTDTLIIVWGITQN